MGLRKRQIRILFFVLLCVFAYTTWAVYSSQNNLSNDDFIRFHVIANSDSEEDQQLKLIVRDGILAKINNELVQETMAQHLADYQSGGAVVVSKSNEEQTESTISLDLESSRKYIRDHLKEIEAAAEEIIIDQGYDYSVKAELGVKWIPQKTYGDIIFPSGNYEALNITIGNGEGKNWWCVLFPPLCLIGVESPENEQLAEQAREVYKDILLDHKYDPLTKEREKPTTLKLKFKSLELLEDLNK
ncbi:stage II sporulation protein R [Sinanaerobacter chloroacetimidivorans]|jgi:stage II sporulation protein R|uniref:Stage II sporulation protein R n=1 Tax=Sinanaerobacter chloroacetimidivorans TaxID=2818044 RepID=A0A8J7W4W1_9FIRM|nr:stage II sporulation protein R [Sinanaerobacter chloroacetimidivorans]MBR0599235.1 stage II sporulation protein R [Sinanaerobacter chloroacetimidivorans]